MAVVPPNLTQSYHNNQSISNPVFQSILMLIVIVLFSWFVLKPRLATFNDTRAQITAAEAQFKKLDAERNDLDLLVKKLQSSPEEVSIVDEALPLNGRISKVSYLLSDLVGRSGMTLGVLGVDDSSKIVAAGDKEVIKEPFKPGRTLHTITVTASLSGSMEQLKNLLELIEGNARVLDVESLQVLGGDEVTKFRLTVKAYSFEYGAQ